MQWNDMANLPVKNPTKYAAVNDLISLVKKKEVRKQGKKSQARKQFEQPEFEKIIDLLEENFDEEARCFASAV